MTALKPDLKVGKEPWLAVNLSTFLPGIGQIYAGQWLKGWLFLSGFLGLLMGGFWLLISDMGDLRGAIACLISAVILAIVNLFDAHQSAKSTNSSAFEAKRTSSKDPWLAVWLSHVTFPGIGHLYLRQNIEQIVFGIVFLLLSIGAGLWLLRFVPFLGIIDIVFVASVVYLAYYQAPIHRERSQRSILLICALLVCLRIAAPISILSIRSTLLEARFIPSEAMMPTLQMGDRVLVEKVSYRHGQPQRQDIIIFMPSRSLRQTNPALTEALLQRIIGLPGETVEVNAGKVFINNQPLTEPYINEPPTYQWGPETVPANSYFVLGDNRNNSFDSHLWGYVPLETIIGRVNKRFYPFDRAGSLP